MKTRQLLLVPLIFSVFSAFAMADDHEYSLVIQNHRFEPSEISIPAGQKVKLKVENKDSMPEEFHSDDLKREKIILGKSTGIIVIGPLKPGRYKFMGEFNESTAQGVVVVK